MPSWLPFTIAAALASTVFNTLLRRNLKNSTDSTTYAWWFEVIRSAFFLLLIPFFPQFDYSPFHLGTLLLLGITEFVAVYLFMKMHSMTELSLSTIILQLRTIWVPMFAYFILSERLTASEWVGVILVVVGAVVVARPRSLRIDRGIAFALVMTIFSALSGVLTKRTLEFASIPIVILFFSLPSVILLPLFMKNPLVRLRQKWQTVTRIHLPTSSANILAMLALAYAFRLGTVSHVTAIFQGSTILTVAVGVFLLHEREHKLEKLAAAALTTAGILLLV